MTMVMITVMAMAWLSPQAGDWPMAYGPCPWPFHHPCHHHRRHPYHPYHHHQVCVVIVTERAMVIVEVMWTVIGRCCTMHALAPLGNTGCMLSPHPLTCRFMYTLSIHLLIRYTLFTPFIIISFYIHSLNTPSLYPHSQYTLSFDTLYSPPLSSYPLISTPLIHPLSYPHSQYILLTCRYTLSLNTPSLSIHPLSQPTLSLNPPSLTPHPLSQPTLSLN